MSKGVVSNVRLPSIVDECASAEPVAFVFQALVDAYREPSYVTWFQLEVDVRADGTRPMNFAFRIGPGLPGTIVFNGPQGQAERKITRIGITERRYSSRTGGPSPMSLAILGQTSAPANRFGVSFSRYVRSSRESHGP